MKYWIFRCDDVSRWVSYSMDTPISFQRRLGIWVHLSMCRYCRLFRRQLLAIRRMCRDTGDDTPETQRPRRLKEQTKARITERLRSAS